jgi:hypothetical protein
MKLFVSISGLLAIALLGSFYLRDSRSASVIAFSPSPVVVSSAKVTPTQQTESLPKPQTLEDLSSAWKQARTLDQLDPIAQSLAEMNTPESVQKLLDGIEHIKEWPVRAAIAKNLRAVSNPEALQVLLPALLNNYGRGNTILNEISDTIARLAQPETVEDLAALHWQASVQAGQGHKVLRTVASIRNPIAARGLMKVANFSESPALAAAAQEALKVIDQPLN